MNIKFSPPDISEKEIQYVADALRSGWITTGPKTKEFEKKIAEYEDIPNAVCLNSATACLEMTLRLLGIGEGDEVITSAYTYTASASIIDHIGAKIVLVDTQKDSYFFDFDRLYDAITPKTKVIIPVNIAGVPADYDKIYQVIEKKKQLFSANNDIQKAFDRIIVVCDGAHSFGAYYKGEKASHGPDFTSYSFHAVKNLTTAEGGAVVWKDIKGISSHDIYNKYMLWSLHGQNKDALSKTKLGCWEYDISILGYKCNMTDIMAGIGLAQLERYDGMLQRRKQMIEYYNEQLGNYVDIIKHYTDTYSSSGHLLLTRVPDIDVEKRNDIIVKMAERGIATNVHYKPLPMHTAYMKKGFDIKNFPNAFNQYRNEITLPLHTLLTDDEVEYVVKNYKEIIRR